MASKDVCKNCGHARRDHVSGAGCKARNQDGELCGCWLFESEADAEVRIALEAARQRDHFVRMLPDGRGGFSPIPNPIPAPIGAVCPEHPTYELVIKDSDAFCRRGQHFYIPSTEDLRTAAVG